MADTFRTHLASCLAIGPSEKDVEILALLLEQLTMGGGKLALAKNLAMEAIRKFAGTRVENCDHLLRLYQIVGRSSVNLGACGIYEQLEARGNFRNSLKFHLLWAESYATRGEAQKFREVVELAKRRVTGIEIAKVEAGFRDIADLHLSDCENLFSTKEATQYDAKKQGRRRSSMAAIQIKLPMTRAPSSTIPKGLRCQIELIDRDSEGYFGISTEELMAARWNDRADMDDAMEISVADPDDVSIAEPPITRPFSKLPRDSLAPIRNRNKEVLVPKSDDLQVLSEHDVSAGSDIKRRRVFSPLQTKPERIPLRPVEADSKKLDHLVPAEKSQSFRDERDYQKAAAIFSDTVCIEANDPPSTGIRSLLADDPTMPLEPIPVKSFDVFVDEPEPEASPVKLKEESPKFAVPAVPVEKKKGLAEIVSPRDPLYDMDDDDDLLSGIPKPNPPNNVHRFDFDDTLIKGNIGVGRLSGVGIVTSTPFTVSRSSKPTEEEFLASFEKSAGEIDEPEPLDKMGFMRGRKSLGSKSMLTSSKSSTVESRMEALKINANQSQPDSKSREDNQAIDMDATGINPPKTVITVGTNPWSPELRASLMANMDPPSELHLYQNVCPKISKRSTFVVSGQTYKVDGLLGEGGYAKVFKAFNESGEPLAIKFEIPACAWEIYICDQLKIRLEEEGTADAILCKNSVMEVTDGYVYSNASLLFNDYLPFGTLLELSSRMTDPAPQLVLFIAIKLAQILKEIHAIDIIHGDAKPDNFMVLTKIPESTTVDELIALPVMKLIDWGRAIDMKELSCQTFQGRAGTANFDCPEMMDGRPWNYHTDYFAYVATMHVFMFGDYCEFKQEGGRYKMNKAMKRRLNCRTVLEPIFDQFLNIPTSGPLPSWDDALEEMITFFRKEFKSYEWRSCAQKFNSCLPTQN